MVEFTIEETVAHKFKLTVKNGGFRLKASARYVQMTFDTYAQAWAELKSRVLAE